MSDKGTEEQTATQREYDRDLETRRFRFALLMAILEAGCRAGGGGSMLDETMLASDVNALMDTAIEAIVS
jgi:hypothetical protein